MNKEFQELVTSLAARPHLAGLLPPRPLLPPLNEWISLQSGEQDARWFHQLAGEGRQEQRLAGWLHDHVRLPEIGDAVTTRLLWDRGFLDPGEDGQQEAKAAFQLLADDLGEPAKGAGVVAGAVVQLKEVQTDPAREDFHRFGFGAIPLLVIDDSAQDQVVALPLLPNTDEPVSEGWTGLKLAGSTLVKSAPSRADALVSGALRCRLFKEQVRTPSAHDPKASLTLVHKLRESNNLAVDPSAAQPWAGLAACDSLWAARQGFEVRQRGRGKSPDKFWEIS
jgi:hypothetical protein